MKKVFITGVGALTSNGETADKTWEALLEGKSSIAPIKNWDISSWTYRLGGELTTLQAAASLLDRKLLKVISKQDLIGINAAIQAIQHSGLLAHREELDDPCSFNEETGIYVGSPGNKYYQQYDFLPLIAKSKDMQAFASQLFNEVHPMWLLRILPNNVLAYTGITYQFKGANHNITNHAVGGVQALLEAYHAIARGQLHRAVVVAYDIGTEPQSLFYYERLGVLSAKHLKPFDKEHDGSILADGAAAIVLESEDSVLERKATCHGEIIGGLSTSENQGLFSIDNQGQALARLMQQVLEKYQLIPSDIDLLVAHGNGNKKSDDTEAQAIEAVFGSPSPPTTAFKWSMGHTLCASGLIDAVLTSYALKNKCVPGIANFQTPSSFALNVDRHRRSLANNRYAMMINRGFASMDACLVIKYSE